MAWELSASPTCLPNGPVSTRCSGFRPNSCPFESLPTAVFVAGKRDFLAREKCANTSPEPRISGLRDQAVVQQAGQFGPFSTTIGNLRNRPNAWWAREDSNLQPDRYERSALTVELRAPESEMRDPIHCVPARGNCVASQRDLSRRRWGHANPAASSRAEQCYIPNSRLALPLRIFALSSSRRGTVSIHCTAGLLATKGQSTANRIRSMPISITQHNSAGLEKLPLVVM